VVTETQAPSSGQRRAVLVGLSLPGQPGWLVEEHLDELDELTRSAGVEVAARAQQQRKTPHAGTFIGRGKAEEVGQAARELGADLAIFDDDLSASQVKNLEEVLDLQVMDRSGLILEIFVQRARTREARTQVELARLEYLLPRLTRRWTHLSRQVGGIGVRGGEGETQLEADRRMLRKRIRQLKRDLEKIERTRQLQRRGRRDVLQIALAGYTNAGKSTLFNQLTRAGAPVEDRLFATLDSKLRRGALSPDTVAVFADTVGFIRKLPHHLVASFKSTLEEITYADLVLHVVDRSHPQWQDQIEVGEAVLKDLGVDADRVMTLFNKSDVVGEVPRNTEGALWISARKGSGLQEMKRAILERLQPPETSVDSDSPELTTVP